MHDLLSASHHRCVPSGTDSTIGNTFLHLAQVNTPGERPRNSRQTWPIPRPPWLGERPGYPRRHRRGGPRGPRSSRCSSGKSCTRRRPTAGRRRRMDDRRRSGSRKLSPAGSDLPAATSGVHGAGSSLRARVALASAWTLKNAGLSQKAYG